MGANPGRRSVRASVRPSILVVEDEPLVSRGLMLLAGKFGQAHLAPTVAAARMALESIDDWVAFVTSGSLTALAWMCSPGRKKCILGRRHSSSPASYRPESRTLHLTSARSLSPSPWTRLASRASYRTPCRALQMPRSSTPLETGPRAMRSSIGEADVLLKSANGASREDIAESRGHRHSLSGGKRAPLAKRRAMLPSATRSSASSARPCGAGDRPTRSLCSTRAIGIRR